MFKRLALTFGIAALSLVPSLAHAAEGEQDPAVYPPGSSIDANGTAVECAGRIPMVTYEVTPNGFTPGADPVTYTLFDINKKQIGDPVPGQPLKGSFLYPGTTLDSNGDAVTWAGWDYINGIWVEVDNNTTIWRKGIYVRFDVNPTTTTFVSYPDDNPDCLPPGVKPPGGGETPTQEGSIPTTGSNAPELFLQIGLLLLVGGGVFLIVSHRRKSSAPAA